jgi:thymidylate synthase
MTALYTFENAAAALKALTFLVTVDGRKVAPRGEMTRELRDVVIQIDNPTDPLMYGMGRNWNPDIAVAEFLQLAGGFSDPERMKKIAPTFANFTDGGTFHGAYGPRTWMQFHNTVRLLRREPNTRQAVVQIWDPQYDQAPGKKDYPCTLGFVFAIRDAELHMSTHMRSNDLWWGWSYDAFQFMQLQCTVANVLGLRPGPYVHYVNSLHLYERDMNSALELVERDSPKNVALSGIGSVADSWADIQQEAYTYFYGPEKKYMLSDSEVFMQERMKGYWE